MRIGNFMVSEGEIIPDHPEQSIPVKDVPRLIAYARFPNDPVRRAAFEKEVEKQMYSDIAAGVLKIHKQH